MPIDRLPIGQYVPEKVDDTAAEYRDAVDALILAALEGDPDA